MTRLVVLVVHGGEPPPWALALQGEDVEWRFTTAERAAIAAAVEDVDVALIDAGVPVTTLARHIHEMAPAVQSVAVVVSTEREALRRAILFAPGLGELWLAEPHEVGSELLGRAANVTHQRERYQRTQPRLSMEQASSRSEAATVSERRIVSEAFLAGLLRVLPDPIFTIDEQGRVLSANDAGDHLLDSAGAEARGQSLWELLVPAIANPQQQASAEAVSFQAERRKVGEKAESWDIRLSPILAGEVRAWAVIAHDLTEHFRVQSQLEEQSVELETQAAELETQKIELEERADAAERAQAVAEKARSEANLANAAKSQFLATMSHELRTPLNAIIGYAQILELQVDSLLTDVQRAYLSRLQSSGNHLLGLINDILDLSKIEASGMEVHAENHRAEDAVRATMEILAPAAAQRRVLLLIDEASADALFTGDVPRVRQVVVNLLSNAVKFTDAGGRVTLNWGRSNSGDNAHLVGEGPWTFIRVSDTGIGIPDELQATVFEPFVQVRGGRTREVGGTGLGLAISKRLARLMGGDLTLRSVAGSGSEFTLWLPAPSGDGPHLEAPAIRAARARRGTANRTTLGMRAVGHMMREQFEEIVDSFVARIRADALFVDRRRLASDLLEDHVGPLVADLAQSLILADDDGDLDAESQREGSAIRTVIAELHGVQRMRIGFSEAEVAREYGLLIEELAARVERMAGGRAEETVLALALLRRLVLRAREETLGRVREIASAREE
ncbi:MAG: PAS domain-containing protein [Gemmatimonadaceae bacterium]|nr:PAS domain-containing protein [Gemmatimonadaceae bacterium]